MENIILKKCFKKIETGLTLLPDGALPLAAHAGRARLVLVHAVLEHDAVSVLRLVGEVAAVGVVLAGEDALGKGLGQQGVDEVAAAGIGLAADACGTPIEHGNGMKIELLQGRVHTFPLP